MPAQQLEKALADVQRHLTSWHPAVPPAAPLGTPSLPPLPRHPLGKGTALRSASFAKGLQFLAHPPPSRASRPFSQHSTGPCSNESDELRLTSPVKAGLCAEGNRNAGAGVWAIPTATRFQILSAPEISFFVWKRAVL